LEHRGLFGVTGKGCRDLLKEKDKPEAKVELKPEIQARRNLNHPEPKPISS